MAEVARENGSAGDGGGSKGHEGALSADVVVLGAGAAGVVAAITAARAGARTLLVEAGPLPGGELISGMAIDGALNACGEWIVGGVGRDILDECRRLGGYVGPLNDWRLIWYVCIDPEIMKLAVARCLAQAGVRLLLNTFAIGVEAGEGAVRSLRVVNKEGFSTVRAPVFVDCSGDAFIVRQAGGEAMKGSESGELQPVSLMFRMSNVQTERLLAFQYDHPENFALGESEAIRRGRTDQELARAAIEQGQPTVFLKGNGPLVKAAIDSGALYPTALIMIQPTSPARREVCLNTTRIGGVDGTRSLALSATLATLSDQVIQCVNFMRDMVPGFEDSVFSGTSGRLGVRETYRIGGLKTLTGDDVLQARKQSDGVAKGSHHVDIHQAGTGQIRIPVKDGGSYDIPWGCLVPKGLRNVVAAGRILSSDRPANGSARVMGPCLGMGQAAGCAALLELESSGSGPDFKRLDVGVLRTRLLQVGAVLDGTH